jgi:hypothetical protein
MKTPERPFQSNELTQSGSQDRQPIVEPKYFSIPEIAERWRCSRGTVYNLIRGEKVVDFAPPGKKGKKIVPADVVRKIEQRHTRAFR